MLVHRLERLACHASGVEGAQVLEVVPAVLVVVLWLMHRPLFLARWSHFDPRSLELFVFGPGPEFLLEPRPLLSEKPRAR